jgi:uncharacterized protein involved in exopolysaccharide biosynthesis
MNTRWRPLELTPVDVRRDPSQAIFDFLFKWHRTVLSVAGFVTILATALAYLIPQSFEAKTAVLVERNRAPVMRTDYSPGVEMAEAMNTARAIASARSVMALTVDTLGLAQRKRSGVLGRTLAAVPVWLGLWPRVDARDAWIQELMKNMDIRPTVSSNILNIAFSNDDPELAAAVVNTVAAKYIELHTQVYSTRGLADFYKKQAEEAEGKYRQLRDQLLAFKAEANYAAAEVMKAESAKELSTLRTQLLTSKAEISRLLQRYDERHAEVGLQRKSIAATEEQIRDIETRLQVLERDAATNADLEMLVDAQRRAFLDYSQRHREAALNQRADQEAVNVRIIEEAAVPVRPKLSRIWIILIGCFAGLLLGLSAALAREYLDARCSTPEQVETALGLPVIGWLDQLPADRIHEMLGVGQSPPQGTAWQKRSRTDRVRRFVGDWLKRASALRARGTLPGAELHSRKDK